MSTSAELRSTSPPHKRARLTSPKTTASELPVETVASTSTAVPPKKVHSGKKANKKKKNPPPPEPGSAEDVNLHDVFSALGPAAVLEAKVSASEYDAPLELFTEVELTVKDICSHGSFC